MNKDAFSSLGFCMNNKIIQNITEFVVEHYNNLQSVDAIFVSCWSNGVVETPCKVNTDTHEVFDITVVEFNGDILEREYIILDGEEYSVSQRNSNEICEYWYD